MEYLLDTFYPTGDYTNIPSEDFRQAVMANCDIDIWDSHSWLILLSLARAYGWTPICTFNRLVHSDFPEEEYKLQNEWSGADLADFWKTVPAEDALNLAAALEKALDDIPENDDIQPEIIEPSPGNRLPESSMVFSGRTPNHEQNFYEYFAGSEKQHVIHFIKFCRKGPFHIKCNYEGQ